MRFHKKNIHNSNLNTFLSLPVSVICGRMCCARLWDMLVSRVCLQEQRKQHFLTLAVSSWLISKSSDIFLYKSSFCASNPWPAFCFVLSPRSSLTTQRRLPPERLPLLTVRWSEREVFIMFEIWIFIYLTKTHGFATGGLYSPPGAVWGMFYYGCACFIWRLVDCWTETPADCIDNAWNSQDNFEFTSDWIRLKEESHIHLGCLEGE